MTIIDISTWQYFSYRFQYIADRCNSASCTLAIHMLIIFCPFQYFFFEWSEKSVATAEQRKQEFSIECKSHVWFPI